MEIIDVIKPQDELTGQISVKDVTFAYPSRSDFKVLENEKVVDEVKNYSFYVNSLKDIPGFEEGLLGMKKNEEKDINVKYPDDYIREDLRDKEVIYKVKVNKVEKKIIPEINDDFVIPLFFHPSMQ